MGCTIMHKTDKVRGWQKLEAEGLMKVITRIRTRHNGAALRYALKRSRDLNIKTSEDLKTIGELFVPRATIH